MLSKLVDTIFDYLRSRSYWSKVEPLLTLLSAYTVTLVFAYQYLEWQFHFSPTLQLFLVSYVVKQISVVYVGIGLIALTLGLRFATNGDRSTPPLTSRIGSVLRKTGRRLIVAGALAAITTAVFLHLSPNSVSDIRIKMIHEPEFNVYAFVYEIYELNRLEKSWHFEVDVDPVYESMLTSTQRQECDGNSLCLAEKLAEADQQTGLVAITDENLGQDSFWENNGGDVSVISTFDWKKYAPPSTYEYLAYSVLVQSILIHLNEQCAGLPMGSFREGRVAYGDLFEFVPRRQEMKAEILAAHLSPKGEELLANCFGIQYMNEVEQLLSLDWLHSPRVRENMQKSFGVRI